MPVNFLFSFQRAIIIIAFLQVNQVCSQQFPKTGNVQPGISTKSTPMPRAITMKDYDFITPDQWQLQTMVDHLLILNTESGCQVRILAPQPFTGDPAKDTEAVFETMYAGWQYRNNGDNQYKLSKGITATGLSFFMKEATMSITTQDGRYHIEEGAALVARADQHIVIIAVRHNPGFTGHQQCINRYETWGRFFNSFHVKGINPVASDTETTTRKLIGVWKLTEGMSVGEYVFAANGNYRFGGAIGSASTGTDKDYEYIKIASWALEGDGSYRVNGNQLTFHKRGDQPEQLQFRLDEVNHGGKGWADRLFILRKDEFGLVETRYERKEP